MSIDLPPRDSEEVAAWTRFTQSSAPAYVAVPFDDWSRSDTPTVIVAQQPSKATVEEESAPEQFLRIINELRQSRTKESTQWYLLLEVVAGSGKRSSAAHHAVDLELGPIVGQMATLAGHAHSAITKHQEHVEHMTFGDSRGAYLLKRSRMQIALLQQYFTESFEDEEILELYPDLTPEDLDHARAFIIDLLG